jgi:hypothetical protein
MNEHPKYYITYMKFHDDAIHDSATVIHKEKIMNDRIRELAEQADIEWLLEHHPKLEKFAELIVRECANVANSGIDPDESHLIGNDILEHFGVEE